MYFLDDKVRADVVSFIQEFLEKIKLLEERKGMEFVNSRSLHCRATLFGERLRLETSKVINVAQLLFALLEENCFGEAKNLLRAAQAALKLGQADSLLLITEMLRSALKDLEADNDTPRIEKQGGMTRTVSYY